VTTPDGTIVQWSDSATAVYGWSEDDALGRPVGDLLVPGEDTDLAEAVMRALRDGVPWEGPFRVRHRDGSTFLAHVRNTPVLADDGGLVAIVGLSYPTGEERFPLLAAERSARTAAERANARLRRLQEVTAALGAAMTTDEVSETVLCRGMELEGAGSAALWLLDETGTALRYASGAGTAPGTDVRFAALPLDLDLPGPAVVRTGRSIFLRSQADRDERWPSLIGTPSLMEAQAVVPLVVSGRPIGCLSFGFPDEREFGAGEQDFLTAFANVAAQVLDRARLFDAERAATARVAFLAEASRVLNSSLDYGETLQRVVGLLLEAFAALVIIDVADPAGGLERVAIAHTDPSKRDVIEMLRDWPVLPDTPAWNVLRTGVPIVLPEMPEEVLREVSDSEERFQAAMALDVGPAMCVPIAATGRVLGIVLLARPRGGTPFTDDDLALATELGARAGSAVENARLFRARTAVAETLQRSLLPPSLPDIDGVELGARYRPALEGLEVGGDFYDCFAVRDGWAFVIGDVVGSGPQAAAVTAVVRHTARAVAPYVDGPEEVVHAVRDALVAGDDDEVFCTLLYGSIAHEDGGVRLSVVGAGHPQPYVVRATGEVTRVDTSGSLLGALPPLGIEAVDCRLSRGDAFVCVTDGVLEARPAPAFGMAKGVTFFDEAGLVKVLRANAGRDADAIAGAIESAVLAFTGGRAPDDVAILVLRAT
jgi:PAS domain S-box-containing protein